MGERRWKEIVLQYSFDLRDWTYEWRRCWMLMVVLFYSIFLLLVSIYSCRSHFTHSTHSLGCTHLELLQFLTFTHFEISWSRINEREWWLEIIFQTTYHENIIEEPLIVSPCTCVSNGRVVTMSSNTLSDGRLKQQQQHITQKGYMLIMLMHNNRADRTQSNANREGKEWDGY